MEASFFIIRPIKESPRNRKAFETGDIVSSGSFPCCISCCIMGVKCNTEGFLSDREVFVKPPATVENKGNGDFSPFPRDWTWRESNPYEQAQKKPI